MREIVLDTETTGLDPFQGHRLVEIGCIELVNRIPDRADASTATSIPSATCRRRPFAIHGLSIEFLQDKPFFAEICEELIAFIGDAPLVAHNAVFDLGFLERRTRALPENCWWRASVWSTRCCWRAAASRRAQPVSIDLCVRYGIDNSRRTKHGALLDAELLAEVYLELIGGRQASLVLVEAGADAGRRADRTAGRSVRPIALAPRLVARGARRASRLHRDARARARSGATIERAGV